MSTEGSLPPSPGALLQQYRLVRRLGGPGSTVWQAEDTRSARNVALKILTRRLPKERAQLESMLREGRQAAAMYHSGMPVILELNTTEDCYFMVMELIEGETLAQLAGKGPLDRNRFFRLAYPVVDAVAYLHGKGIVHSSINSDSILVSRAGNVKLLGLGTRNILRKSELSSPLPEDTRAVGFMAPEQIAGRPLDEKVDIFALGALFYEMLTGKLPFTGATSAEVAAKIAREQPASPKALNPSVDGTALNLTGRCLFKDPSKRFANARAILDEMKKAEPSLARLDTQRQAPVQPAASEPPAEATPPPPRDGVIFVADIPYYESLEKEDPARALRMASRMQQIVGEAVYFFDGNISESLGPIMVAELPTAKKAFEAAAKAKTDLQAWNAAEPESARIEPRMVLHAGPTVQKGGKTAGPSLDLALSALEAVQPLQLIVSEAVVRSAGIERAGNPVGTLAGVRFFQPGTAAVTAPAPEAAPGSPLAAAAPRSAPEGPQSVSPEAVPAAKAPEPRPTPATPAEGGWKRLTRSQVIPITAVAVVVLAVILAVASWWQSENSKVRPVVGVRTVASRPVKPRAIQARVAIDDFTTGSPDAAANERANRIRLASMEILRSIRPVQVVPDSAAEVRFGGRVRDGAGGPELVPIVGTAEAGTIPLGGGATARSATATYVALILREVGLPAERLTLPSEKAFETFAAAVAAYEAGGRANSPQAASLIRSSIVADPNFLPAQRLAMRLFAQEGNDRAAMVAGRQVIDLDPEDTDALRAVAKYEIHAADAVSAIAHFQQILDHEPFDADALEAIGQYSLSVGGDAAFRHILVRLSGAKPARPRPLHEPDLLVYQGKFDQAVNVYYDLERSDPSNPTLALKIGRIAVLRHSMEMAQLELEKLRRLDPEYGYHVLRAYIHAEKRQRRDAVAEMSVAAANARWNDHPYTDAAQVAAIANDTPRVIESLRKAVERGEPTFNYILNNPLFAYLADDKRYAGVRTALQARMGEISDQLAKSRL